MIFIVTSKATGEVVYEYPADAAIEWNGMEFATHDHVERQEALVSLPTVFGGRRTLTKLEFRSLFSTTALKAIDRFEAQFEASPYLTDSQKDDVRTAFNDYREAEDVNLDDPRWAPGLGLYVALGMMTAEEVTEVLNG